MRKPGATFRAYADAKLMLLVWTRELNRRLRGTGIDTFAVHPGEQQLLERVMSCDADCKK